jgi:hypothetical protein
MGMRPKELSHGIIRDLLLQNNPDFEVVFVRHAGRVSKLTFMVMIMEFEKTCLYQLSVFSTREKYFNAHYGSSLNLMIRKTSKDVHNLRHIDSIKGHALGVSMQAVVSVDFRLC